MSAARDDLAEGLRGHWPAGFVNSRENWEECECGDRLPGVFDRDGYHIDAEAEQDAWAKHRADALLASPAFARLLDAARGEGAVTALREAAEEVEALRSFAHGKNPTSEAHLIGYGTARRVVVRLLLGRADSITRAAKEGL